MSIKDLERVFKYNDNELSDPNPTMTPEEVIDFYSNQYPEFTNAKHTMKLENNKAVYNISASVGTKG